MWQSLRVAMCSQTDTVILVMLRSKSTATNGLMLMANRYMSLANDRTHRSNGLMLTSNVWANASNVFKKTPMDN